MGISTMHRKAPPFPQLQIIALSVIFLFFLNACGQATEIASVDIDQSHARENVEAEVQQQVEYQQHASDLLPVMEVLVKNFSESINVFLNNPEEASLAVARQRWRQLHENLVSIEVYFNPGLNSRDVAQLWFSIEAWPLEPGFIDSLPEYPYSGIINDLALGMTEASLRSQDGATSPMEVSSGMHAAEYLLWQRPVEDFYPRNLLTAAELESGLSEEQLGNNRRREMLRLIANMLSKDLASLQLHLTSSLSPGSSAALFSSDAAAHHALQAIKRTLLELQQNSIDVHSVYSRSWRQDMLNQIQQVSFIVDLQTRQAVINSDISINQSLSETLQGLSALDSVKQKQLTANLDLINRLDQQVDAIFGTTSH